MGHIWIPWLGWGKSFYMGWETKLEPLLSSNFSCIIDEKEMYIPLKVVQQLG